MTTTFDRLVILDFEATCQANSVPDPQEIIEFPSVLLDLREDRIVDEFTSFVRPIQHPKLSEFCTELTSIRQEHVADAPIFSEVFARHYTWLLGHDLVDGERPGVIVTCGDWDLNTMLPKQCRAVEQAIDVLPVIYRRWINIKKIFTKTRRQAKAFGMPSMLRDLGLELIGRHHRGIDDCRNIARIAQALAVLGAEFKPTSRFSPSRYPPISLLLRRGDERHRVTLKKRVLPSLLGLASSAFRSQIVAIRGADGAQLCDDDLSELEAESELVCLTKRDLAELKAEAAGDGE